MSISSILAGASSSAQKKELDFLSLFALTLGTSGVCDGIVSDALKELHPDVKRVSDIRYKVFDWNAEREIAPYIHTLCLRFGENEKLKEATQRVLEKMRAYMDPDISRDTILGSRLRIVMMRFEMYSGTGEATWEEAIKSGNLNYCANAMFQGMHFPPAWISALGGYIRIGFFLFACRSLFVAGNTQNPLLRPGVGREMAKSLLKEMPGLYGDVALFFLYLQEGPSLAQDEEYGPMLLEWDKKARFPFSAGFHALFQGQAKVALDLLLVSRKYVKRREIGTEYVYYVILEEVTSSAIALARFILAEEDDKQRGILEKEITPSSFVPEMFFRALIELRDGHAEDADAILARELNFSQVQYGDIVSTALALSLFARCKKRTSQCKDQIKEKRKEFCPNFAFLCDVCDNALAVVDERKEPAERSFPLDLTQLVPNMEAWERSVSSLKALISGAFGGGEKRRLLWRLNFGSHTVSPYEQSVGVKGAWLRGKPVSVKRLHDGVMSINWLTAQDRDVIRQSIRERWGNTYVFLFEAAVPALIGHPNVEDETTGEPISLVRAKGELRIADHGKDECALTASKAMLEPLACEKGDNGVWKVYQTPPEIVAIAKEIQSKAFIFPKAALGQILESLQLCGDQAPLRLDIKSDTVERVSTPVLQIAPAYGRYQGRFRVRPFGFPDSPDFDPGEGPENPVATIKIGATGEAEPKPKKGAKPSQNLAPARSLTVQRNFDEELEALMALLDACPELSSHTNDFCANFSGEEELLESLVELKTSGVKHVLEWPQGESVRVAGVLGKESVSLKVGDGKNDWFSVDGELRIDEERVLALASLIQNMGSRKGRFIPLGDGEYVALTSELRRAIERMRLLSAQDSKGKLRFNALAAGVLDESLDGIDVKANAAWSKAIAKMSEALALNPKIPSGLQAELRPYQREGIEWLLRLAHWGVGACLADDMGLGKTLQTIAAMLSFASEGPCLVVAPTSVCSNWESEINRFAPSLEVVRFGTQDEREKQVKRMKAGQVLIVGYGILHIEQELLAGRTWRMVVFDEAQALKNAQTLRSQAGRSIPADFRVALTGTPIENRLDDLWSLFSVINPGLLGSAQTFRQHFGKASAGSGEMRVLKKAVRPFLLRRLKSHVLDDLPEKTEQTIIVEPTETELAAYEALRRKALETLEGIEGKAGERRIRILAELTRLRLACCHVALVADELSSHIEKESSKLLRFLDILEELKASGHKALAFSQFVKHLALIREALDKRGISYAYLDGTTPEAKRAEAVAAFQAGKYDVFLISLKAGGQGLNLTAADYVFHLDPWWNPAVEDQASDRAHRIGQRHPVTVYRLVMKGSVEEKILSLHKAKKELAADFLEGTDSGAIAPLSEEDLLALFS